MQLIGNNFSLVIFYVILLGISGANISANGTLRADSDKMYNNCDRIWPKMSFFVPIHLKNDSHRNTEWSDIFLHSLTMFWPFKASNTSLVVVLDIEAKDSQLQTQFVDKVIADHKNVSNSPQITLKYHTANITYQSGYRGGHDRQQHMMFYADQYTDDEYIAFGDSDCLFYTHIDREDIFEDGKPVVHGRIGYMQKREYKAQWSASTWRALGLEQPMICMSYFPVVMKASHLKDLREFVEKKYKMSFDQAFQKFGSGQAFSQFNIMCAYMFTFKREEYKWYVSDATPWWDGNNPKPVFGQWGERYVFTPEMFKPKPFITAHARYRLTSFPVIDKPENMNKLILRGLCHTVPNNTLLNYNCSEYLQRTPYFDEMHMFEEMNYNINLEGRNHSQFVSNCVSAEMERRKRFQKCDLLYSKVEILKHFQKFHYTPMKYEKLLR